MMYYIWVNAGICMSFRLHSQVRDFLTLHSGVCVREKISDFLTIQKVVWETFWHVIHKYVCDFLTLHLQVYVRLSDTCDTSFGDFLILHSQICVRRSHHSQVCKCVRDFLTCHEKVRVWISDFIHKCVRLTLVCAWEILSVASFISVSVTS